MVMNNAARQQAAGWGVAGALALEPGRGCGERWSQDGGAEGGSELRAVLRAGERRQQGVRVPREAHRQCFESLRELQRQPGE